MNKDMNSSSAYEGQFYIKKKDSVGCSEGHRKCKERMYVDDNNTRTGKKIGKATDVEMVNKGQ